MYSNINVIKVSAIHKHTVLKQLFVGVQRLAVTVYCMYSDIKKRTN